MIWCTPTEFVVFNYLFELSSVVKEQHQIRRQDGVFHKFQYMFVLLGGKSAQNIVSIRLSERRKESMKTVLVIVIGNFLKPFSETPLAVK